MIGDKLVITDYHRKAAAQVFSQLAPKLKEAQSPLAVSVAGESGCGKSETAAVLAELCEKEGYKTIILQQDDYFVYPPATNHNTRLKDINWVGLQEVKLNIMEENIASVKEQKEATVKKPLVIFDEDKITDEEVSVSGVKVVIAEGTYTTTLKNVDLKCFINRNYKQTKKARLKRSRDPATEFLEQVLAIEHNIISAHKKLAHVVIDPPEDEKE